MTVTGGDTIVDCDLVAFASRFRARSEVELERLPRVTRLGLQPEARSWFVAAVGHAVFAARIFRHSVDYAVLVPINLLEQFGVTVEMAGAVGADGVGHEITGCFPTTNVASRDRPSRAGQVAFAGQKFEINRRPEK